MVVFDIDDCIAKLLQKRLLGEALLREICEKTKEVLMRESNVVHVAAPVTVVGDIHGCVSLDPLYCCCWSAGPGRTERWCRGLRGRRSDTATWTAQEPSPAARGPEPSVERRRARAPS